MSNLRCVSDLDPVRACAEGVYLQKSEIWEHILTDCIARLKLKKRFQSSDAQRRAILNIRALQTRASTAALDDACATAVRRYIFEERLRAILANAYEKKFPFVWKMHWSQNRFKEVLEESAMLLRDLFFSKSFILRSMNIFVVASIIETIAKLHISREPEWWLHDCNVDSVRRLSVRKCVNSNKKEFAMSQLTEIQTSLSLYVAAMKHLKSRLPEEEFLSYTDVAESVLKDAEKKVIFEKERSTALGIEHYMGLQELLEVATLAKHVVRFTVLTGTLESTARRLA